MLQQFKQQPDISPVIFTPGRLREVQALALMLVSGHHQPDARESCSGQRHNGLRPVREQFKPPQLPKSRVAVT